MDSLLSLLVLGAVALEVTGLGLLVAGWGVGTVALLWVAALALILVARVGEHATDAVA